jgi:putative transposase
MDIRPEILDELLAAADDPNKLFGTDGLVATLTARLVERVTEVELGAHLRAEATAGRKNTRNGRTKRRLLSARGPLDVSMPRDRAATFEPQLAPKYLRRLPDFDEKVLLLYSRGLSTRDIQGHLKELYQTEVSAELISDVTDALVPLFQAWQARPLAPCYVMVFLDALFVKVRVDGRVQTRALVTALGVTLDGLKDVLGLWSLATESASAYVGVLTELQARGVEDIVVVATDGLTGAAEAVAAVFPRADHQRCLVHQMRSSLALVTHTDRKAVATSLKAVYNATTESEAELRLAEAEAEWGARYLPSTEGRSGLRLVAPTLAIAGDLPALPRRAPAGALHHERGRGGASKLPAGAQAPGPAAQRDVGAEAVLRDGDAAFGEMDPCAEPLADGGQPTGRERP